MFAFSSGFRPFIPPTRATGVIGGEGRTGGERFSLDEKRVAIQELSTISNDRCEMLLLFTFEMTLMKRIDRMDGKAFWVRLSMSMYRAFKVFGFFFFFLMKCAYLTKIEKIVRAKNIRSSSSFSRFFELSITCNFLETYFSLQRIFIQQFFYRIPSFSKFNFSQRSQTLSICIYIHKTQNFFSIPTRIQHEYIQCVINIFLTY